LGETFVLFKIVGRRRHDRAIATDVQVEFQGEGRLAAPAFSRERGGDAFGVGATAKDMAPS
jgi:hypothetical protein